MKVLHIISGDIWAGAEVQASGLVVALSRQHTIDQKVVTFNDGTLARLLRQRGVSVEIVRESGTRLPSLVGACRRIIENFQPDITHAHGFKENLVGGIASRLKRIKVVRTHHGKGMIGVARRYNVVERMNARFLSDALIVVSCDLEEFLGEFGLPRRKMSVVVNGVDPVTPSTPKQLLALKQQLGLPESSVVVGTIGRLVPVKDQSVFLRGARTIRDADSRVSFVIVGDGPLMSELVREAEALGIGDCTVFTGGREDGARIGEVFDIFALTSRHEGIPMALLETMSLGKPVVATRVGGIPEVIRDGTSGILVPSNDPKSFAGACLEMIGNEALRSRLSQAAAVDIRDRFSMESCASRTYAVYQRVVAA